MSGGVRQPIGSGTSSMTKACCLCLGVSGPFGPVRYPKGIPDFGLRKVRKVFIGLTGLSAIAFIKPLPSFGLLHFLHLCGNVQTLVKSGLWNTFFGLAEFLPFRGG